MSFVEIHVRPTFTSGLLYQIVDVFTLVCCDLFVLVPSALWAIKQSRHCILLGASGSLTDGPVVFPLLM